MFPLATSLALLLACCSQQLLQVHAESRRLDPHLSSHPPFLPGDKRYVVKLKHLDVSEGHLNPAFRPDHQQYSLKVEDQYVKHIDFTIGFDLDMYNLRHTPDLVLDGKKVNYNSLKLISVVIPLNETIGTYDRTHQLRVQDPKEHKIGLIDMTKHFDYYFHIEQQAEYGQVVKATDISVKVKDGKNVGKVIPSTPTFKPFPEGNSFEFNVSHSDRLLDVRVDCSEHATSRFVDGELSHQPRGSWMEVSMKGYVKKQVTVSCVFKDPKTSDETVLTYTLTFFRDVDLRNTTVDLFMMPEYGFCLPRSIYDDRRNGWREGQQLERTPNYSKGFVCLSDKPQFQIMSKINIHSGDLGAKSVEVVLTDPKTRDGAMLLKHYVPVHMTQLKERRTAKLEVRRGRDTEELEVLFIWPEDCAAARCPDHHAPREIPDSGANAEDHMCLEEACTKADVPRCCERLSFCKKMQCPAHPAAQVKGWNCMGTMCNAEDDKKHCCDGWSSCNEFVCPAKKIRRPNASRILCKTTMCTMRDTDLCCEDRATCTEFENNFGCMQNRKKVNLPPGAAFRHCVDFVCSPEDKEHCCGNVASCVGYQCPGGWLMRPNPQAFTCTGQVCQPRDAPRCCSKANPNHKPVVDEKGRIARQYPDKTCDVQLANGKVASRVPSWAIREPSGKKQHAAGDKVTVRKAQDNSGFFPYIKAVQQQGGEIVKNLNNGAYKVKFADGEVANVPEWSLACDDCGAERRGRSVLKAGTRVEAAVSEDGDFIQHGSFGGHIRKIHPDGTNLVEFDDGEMEDHIPPWAMHGVDSEGHIFVHSAQMCNNERVIVNKLRNGGYRMVRHATGTVTSANKDGTYTVKYLSGEQDSHVPKWDVRAVDDHGRTVPMETVKEGTLVEVNLEEAGRAGPSILDLPRTRYLFGYIEKANPDGITYVVKYDLGIVEVQVPGWAIKKIEEDGVGRSHSEYKRGERVEARMTLANAIGVPQNRHASLGIATREKMAVYEANDCWPAAEPCRDFDPKPHAIPPTPEEIPRLPAYQSWRNPYGLKLCYYEPACSTNPELKGCNVGKNRPSKNCRYCGFDNYDKCKRPYHCQLGDPKRWQQAHRDWCCSAYNIGCKYQCRWGKWWPDEAKGWGPWWSTQKRDWCCKNQKIGCQKKKTKASSLMFKFAESEEQRHQRPPPKSLSSQPMISTLAFTATALLGVAIAASLLTIAIRRRPWKRFGRSRFDDRRRLMVVSGRLRRKEIPQEVPDEDAQPLLSF